MSERNDKYEYFIEQTNKRIEMMDKKLDDLFVFKWKVIGGSAVATAIVSAVLEITFTYLGHR